MTYGNKIQYYVGYYHDMHCGDSADVFGTDSPDGATPEASGYDLVEGPFDTEAEAQEIADRVI